MKKITLSEIAALAGVSTATVSRVFNQKELNKVSAAKRALVEGIMREHHFCPDARGRSLASGRSHLLGLLMSSFRIPIVNSAFLEEISLEADRRGYGVIAGLGQSDYQYRAVDHLLSQGVDGLIWQPQDMVESSFLEHIRNSGIKVVWLNKEVESHFPTVRTDEEQVGILAGEYLFSRGVTNCVFIANLSDSHTKSRWHGFQRCLASHGIDSEFLEGNGFDAAKVASDCRHSRCGFFTSNHRTAITLEHHFRRLEISDCPVIAYGDRELAEQYDSPLPLISPDSTALSRAAIEEVLTPDIPENRQIVIAPQLIRPFDMQ